MWWPTLIGECVILMAGQIRWIGIYPSYAYLRKTRVLGVTVPFGVGHEWSTTLPPILVFGGLFLPTWPLLIFIYRSLLSSYRIPPYCGACTYIRNHPIFQGEKSASYIGAPLPVSYSAACTYIRNPKEKLNLWKPLKMHVLGIKLAIFISNR